MNKRYNNLLIIIIIVIIFTIIGYLNISYGYDIDSLDKGDILIGNDIYKGYVGPNKLISSSINYYKETKETTPLVLYKYEGDNTSINTWSYLQNNGNYKQLSEEGIIKLEVNRIVHNAKNKLTSFSQEELTSKSTYKQGNRYYFFENDLINIGIYFTKTIEGYLIYEENKILDYNFNYENKKYERFNNYEKIIRVSDYGAIINDGIDDTEALKKAVEVLTQNNGGVLLFENGTYDVSIENEFPVENNKVDYGYYYKLASPYNTVMDIRNITGKVVVDLNGATLKLAENTMPGYRIFLFYKCDDITVKNGKLIGDRMTHDYDPHEESGIYSQWIDNHEWGYGIHIIKSNSFVDNIKVENFTGDGIFYIDRSPEQISKHLIYNSEVSRCRRNGITIEELLSITANKVYIHDIGDSDEVLGTNPKAGIDIESEYTGVPTKNIYFNDLKIENATNYTIISGKPNYTENFNINNSILIGTSTFPNAKITNSILNNNKKGSTSSLKNVTAENTEFYVSAHKAWLSLVENSKINNSILKGAYSDTTGNYLRISPETIITNSEISKFQGYYLYTKPDGSTKVIRYSRNVTGILVTDESSKNWENNVFDDCFITFTNTKNENKTEYLNIFQNNTIYNSTLWYHNDNLKTKLLLNNMNFYNSKLDSYDTYLKDYINVDIYDSYFENTIFDEANTYTKNTNIFLNELNRKLHYITKSKKSEGIYDNSTIEVNKNISSKNNFENLKLINNSKIILNNYNSETPIINDNSILNTDYFVEYNGDSILN